MERYKNVFGNMIFFEPAVTLSMYDAYVNMRTFFLIAITIGTFSANAQFDYRYDSINQIEQWYDSSGVSYEYIWLDGWNHHDRKVNNYYENGQKYQSYRELNQQRVDTFRQWSRTGSLEQLEIYSDTGYTLLEFWSESGFIFQKGQFSMLDSFISVNFRDTSYGYDCDCKTVADKGYVPIGTWYTFRENGTLESIGQYLPANVLCTCRYYDSIGNITLGYPKDTVYMWVLTTGIQPDGKWIFFNDAGNAVREEYYEGGLLRTTKDIEE